MASHPIRRHSSYLDKLVFVRFINIVRINVELLERKVAAPV
jgi:hypothetical protein